eukprot:snap_masked-scaffold_40-processed-gene-0.42-mRNA-1 protein AED:1.00 eAED:1.00 QI:0/-1/0/0/-1/1/1/0/351
MKLATTLLSNLFLFTSSHIASQTHQGDKRSTQGIILPGGVGFEDYIRCREFLPTLIGSSTPWDDLFLQLLGTEKDKKTYADALFPLDKGLDFMYNGEEPGLDNYTRILYVSPEAGLHLQAFLYDFPTRIDPSNRTHYLMFTFRGRTTDSDTCANEIYYSYRNESGGRSQSCIDSYTEEEMDYITQADELIRGTIDSLNLEFGQRLKVLFAGYSFGGALAGYMKSWYSARDQMFSFGVNVDFASITWGSPGYRSIIEVEENEVGGPGCSLIRYSPYDPITVAPNAWANQAGYMCEYNEDDIEEPETCKTCFAQEFPDYWNCRPCTVDAHIDHYQDVVEFGNFSVPICTYIPL